MNWYQLFKQSLSARDRGNFSPIDYQFNHFDKSNFLGVLTNPTKEQIDRLVRSSAKGVARGVEIDGKQFWWDADQGLHGLMAMRLGLIQDLNESYKLDKLEAKIVGGQVIVQPVEMGFVRNNPVDSSNFAG